MRDKISPATGLPVVAACLALLMSLAVPAGATEAVPADLSLEELLKVEVQTASRKSQRLQDVAAAVFVITREDIERSGATSLPEALRLAPGVQVARLANNRWAVSARGFNGRFANKLLVLMDGRSIYSPLFSGVMWEMEDTLLEDIDRIEVIRGPGAALWGANAVNGVINIITRHTRDTRGTLVVAGAGSEERGFTALRHGATVGDGTLRVWAKAFDRDTSVNLAGQEANDDWRAARLGFRGDWSLGADRRLTVSGSAHGGPTGDRWNFASLTSPTGTAPMNVDQKGSGAHLLVRHEWLPADGSASTLQAYVDRTQLEVVGVVAEQRTTIDIDFQRRRPPGGPHDLIWGLSHRQTQDRIDSSSSIAILPARQRSSLTSAFVHDEITLQPETLRLVLGARLEHNDFTGLEPQPNARVMWTPTPQQALWASASRAVRTPSRAEQDARVDLSVMPAGPASPPVLLRNVPAALDGLQAETVTALELGYRHRFDPQVALDVALFRNRYRHLRGGLTGAQRLETTPFPYVVQEITPSNVARGVTTGVEVALDWHPTRWWRLQAGASVFDASLESTVADPIAVGSAVSLAASAPRHQLSMRSSMSLEGRQQLDFWVRHVARLDATGPGTAGVPAYTTLDLRYAWRVLPGLELSLVAQNLLDSRHTEFVPDLLPSETVAIQRGWYAKAKWQF